jgi:hypothetical protein
MENERKLYLTRRQIKLTNKTAEKSDEGRPNGQLFTKDGEDPTLIQYLGERTMVLAKFNSGHYVLIYVLIS